MARSANRLLRAWQLLPHERRLAAGAAIGLFVTLFLPWYQETVIVSAKRSRLETASESLTGWGAFSFVEAAVLLVAVAVLTLLLHRAEGRAFHLPGGDGGVIASAGGWTCLLVIWRIFDKQGTTGHHQFASSSGIEWGILLALAVAALLTYAGSRISAAHAPEPPLPGERAPGGSAARWSRRSVPDRRRAPDHGAEPSRSSAPGGGTPRERPTGWLTAPPASPADAEPALAHAAVEPMPRPEPRRRPPASLQREHRVED